MPATAEQSDPDTRADRPTALSPDQARREDAYWQRTCWQERYFEDDFDYEDYAPAYCVGYAGCAQYGGEFRDAEHCLRANWERIKGDSRLALEQALPAIRAGWQRMARLRQRLQPAVNDARFTHPRVRAGMGLRRTAPGVAARA